MKVMKSIAVLMVWGWVVQGPGQEPTRPPTQLRSTTQTAKQLAAATLTATMLTSTMLTSGELWQADKVPFSFRYGGKASATLLQGWKYTVEAAAPAEQGGGAEIRRYRYVDPGTRLRVTAEVRLYPEFPEVVDWVLRFRNEGLVDTPLLEEILPLDSRVPASAKLAVVHHAKGSDARADDYMPVEEQMVPGQNDRLESALGLSSSRNTLPFFNLQTGDRGLVGAIGWSGDWRADFAYRKDGTSIGLTSGMKRTHLVLHAGEEIRTPRIVLMSWTGGSWADAQNRWRRLVLARYTPRADGGTRAVAGKPMLGPILFGSWGSEPVADKIAYVRWAHEHGLPFEVYAVDAGWYGASVGAESDPTNPEWSPWYRNRGDWYASKRYYPAGMGELGGELKRDGYGFSLWLEPETAMRGTTIVKEHPGWYLQRPQETGVATLPWADFDAEMVNLGEGEARAGMTKLVSDAITQYGMTWYRQDFNVPPSFYWEHADAPDRIGMTEIGHITGLYQMWDDLLRAHPGLRIDNCASGGRRLDLEMMSRSFAIWRTDHGFADTIAEQAQTTGLAPWVPLSMAFETYTGTSPWKQPGPYETPEHVYLMRLGYAAGFGTAPGGHGLDDAGWTAWVKHALAEYREVQPYFYEDFYAQVPHSLNEESWTGWQWDRPEKRDGLAVLLRRPKSPFAEITLNLQHLESGARYEVELRRGYERGPLREMRGGELAHLQVRLADAPGSVLVFYRRL